MLERIKGEVSHRYEQLSESVFISVTPEYVPEKSNELAQYHFFAYSVHIKNLRQTPIRLMGRHWIIRDGKKRERFVNGEGVVGKTPLLEYGEEFEYQSFCPLSTKTGNMRGKLLFREEYGPNDKGQSFWVPIPVFFFRTPDTFH